MLLIFLFVALARSAPAHATKPSLQERVEHSERGVAALEEKLSKLEAELKSQQQTREAELRIRQELEKAAKSNFEWARSTFNIVLGVLTLLGIVVAAASFFGYRTIRGFIRKTAKEESERIGHEFVQRTKAYEAVDFYKEDPDRAIADTKAALYGDLRSYGDVRLEHQVILKINLAYYYAFRKRRDDAEEALQLAKEAAEEGVRYLGRRLIELLINYGYVKAEFATSEEDMRDADNFLRSLLDRADCSGENRTEAEGYLRELRGNTY